MFEDVGQPPAGGNDDKRGCVFKDRGGDCAGRSGRHEGCRRVADQTFCGQCDGGISDGQERTPGTAGTECAGEGTASVSYTHLQGVVILMRQSVFIMALCLDCWQIYQISFQYAQTGRVVWAVSYTHLLNKSLAQFKEGFGTQFGINRTYTKKLGEEYHE